MSQIFSRNKIIPALLALLRILIGWQFLYEGLIKLFDPAWSARPYLEGSRWIFGDIFRWIASGSAGIHIIDFLNAWGLTAVGLALMLGIFTRLASWAGIIMLSMYYLAYPPFGGYSYGAVTEGSYLIVSKNLIELAALLVLVFTRSGNFFGLDMLLKKKKKEIKPAANEPEPVPEPVNKRRELLKGLAGLPFLAGFAGVYLRELSEP